VAEQFRVNAKFALILALSAAAVVVAVAVASYLLHDRMMTVVRPNSPSCWIMRRRMRSAGR